MGPRLKLPRFVHGFVDRHGKPRFYFRRLGLKQVPLPGLPYSSEFMDAYQTALGTEHRTEINASRTAPGTINALVVSYYKSDAWKNGLEEETRKTRRRIIEKFRTEHGDKRVALLQRGHVEKMLAEIEKPSARRHWLMIIHALITVAATTTMNQATIGRSAKKRFMHHALEKN
jgi:hypothetical protein